MRKIKKIRNVAIVVLCLSIWNGCAGLAEKESLEETQIRQTDMTATQEMEREAILDEEISQPVEKAPLDEALRRWNVSGELLKDMLLRYFSNLNFRYEQEARNGDHPKENDPLQYLNPYGEYFIEVYEVLADLPPDEEYLALNPYSNYLYEGELLVHEGAVEWLEDEDAGQGIYEMVGRNELGYFCLHSVTIPGTVDELEEYLRPVYKDTFYVVRDQRYAYEDFPEKRRIVEGVRSEMEALLDDRLAKGDTAEVYILDFEVHECYVNIQAVSYIDDILYVDVFCAGKDGCEIVIWEVQRGSGQIRLEAEEQRQEGYTREMVQERAIEVFMYPE